MANEFKNARIVLKHDTEENWNKALNFIPQKGEYIIYDIDDNNPKARIKLGDGINIPKDLPFVVPTRTSELINDGSSILKEGTPLVGWDELGDILDSYDKKFIEYDDKIFQIKVPTKTSELINDGDGSQYSGPFVDMGEVNDYVNERSKYSMTEALEADNGYFLLITARAVADYVNDVTGDIETAIDEIIALQNSILGEGE